MQSVQAGSANKKSPSLFYGFRCALSKGFLVALFAVVFLSLFSPYAGAGVPEVARTPCDPGYWSTLRARAWIEAEREVMQNQNLIFKPDSVMEYTCFDKFVNVVAKEGINLFSETQHWGLIKEPDSLDNALQRLVGKGIIEWVEGNYEKNEDGTTYDFLGGRMPGTDYDPGSIAGGDYFCDHMNAIWKKAKCINFVDDPDFDGFYYFDELATTQADPRHLPQPCDGIQAKFLPNWEGSDDRNPFDDLDTTPPWTEDYTLTFIDNLKSCRKIITDSSGNRTILSGPVNTGLVVTQKTEPTRYYEKICIAPGCYYKPTGLNTGYCLLNGEGM